MSQTQSPSTGPSGADFAPPSGPPPGLSQPSPAPAKPDDARPESSVTSSVPEPTTPGPVSGVSAPPPIHLVPTSNQSEPSPIDLDYSTKKLAALQTPSGLSNVQYGSTQPASEAGQNPSLPLSPLPEASPGQAATSAPEAGKDNVYELDSGTTIQGPQTALMPAASQNTSSPEHPYELDAGSTIQSPQTGSVPVTSQNSYQAKHSPSYSGAAPSSSQIPPPPGSPPTPLDAASQQAQNAISVSQTPIPSPNQLDGVPKPSQAGPPTGYIPPPPPFPPPSNRPETTTTTNQSEASSIPHSAQFPPPPNRPEMTTPSQPDATSAPPPPPQFPPPPGQQMAPAKAGFLNLPDKFHVWTTWEKSEATDGHSVPCMAMGPEPFGTPAYSAKMGESLSFRAGKWPGDGPVVGEVQGKGTLNTRSVLQYNSFETEFANTGVALVDIGSMGVWQFSVPAAGDRAGETWEWRRVKDTDAQGGFMGRLGKMAGLVGSLALARSGEPGTTAPFATWTKSPSSKFKKESDLGVLEFHGPAKGAAMGDAFQALAIMSIVKIQQDHRDESVAGMLKGSLSSSSWRS